MASEVIETLVEIEARLKAETFVTSFDALLPHAARDALLRVDGSLDLIAVGVAIATDRIHVVKLWTSAGLVRKPSAVELETWTLRPKDECFRFIIVQPYVLVQELVD